MLIVKRNFAYAVMHSGAFFFLFLFFSFLSFVYNLEAEFMFFAYLSSGILNVNSMRMMRNTAVLRVKGSAIVPFVVVNVVKHMLESRDAINPLHHLHRHHDAVVSSLAPIRTRHLHCL